MLKFYFKTAFRNLLRNRVHTIINLLGLSLGIAFALIAFLIVSFELSFDKHHPQVEKTYRVVTIPEFSGEIFYNPGVAYSVPSMLRDNIPEVEVISKLVSRGGTKVKWIHQDAQGNEQVKDVEINNAASITNKYFELFQVEWLYGNPETSLSSPNSIVLSEKQAKQIFGEISPIGQTLQWKTWDEEYEIQVTGIMANPKLNSNLGFNALIPYSLTDNKPDKEVYTSVNGDDQCFITINSQDIKAVEDKINELYLEKIKDDPYVDKWLLGLQPLSDVHFNPNYGTPTGKISNKRLLWALVAIGIFLVITACINYINLSTALSVSRSKEVGIRKVMGSRKSSLIIQFLSETLLLSTLALIFSLGIVELFMLGMHQFIDLGVEVNLLRDALSSGIWVYLFLLIILLITSFAAGFYPAVVMSSFSPIVSLKNKLSSRGKNGLKLRRVLVVFQFMLSQVLIVGTLVVIFQMDYIQDKDLGFDQTAVVGLSLPFNSEYTEKETYKLEAARIAGISAAALSNSPPFSRNRNSQDININNGKEKVKKMADIKKVEPNFLDIYNLKLIAGRSFIASDTLYEIVVNEQFLKMAGITDPQKALSSEIEITSLDGEPYPIVGVVKDFHMQTLHDEIRPLFIGSEKYNMSFLNLKVNPNQWQSTRTALEKIWKERFPEDTFDPYFLDDKVTDFYKEEKRILRLFNLFSGLAIFISCLGLYGLVSFLALQKKKEVGIRKVLGASISSIIMLFSLEFVKLLFIALIVSIPLGWWLMDNWLEDFAYRIEIDYKIFLLAGAAALFISLLTISFRSVKAALANPANSLRSE